MEAYYIVRAIVREIVDIKRIVIRDKQTYCGILFDDNNRKPICRLWLSTTQKAVSFFDNPERKEEKVLIREIDDLYKYADRLRSTVQGYMKVKE